MYSRGKVETLHRNMVGLGARLTGSQAHIDFIESIVQELEKMGYEVHRDTNIMKKRWEPKRWKLTLTLGDEIIEIPKVFYYPYSGKTDPEGITAKMINCGVGIGLYALSLNKIAIYAMPVFEAEAGLIFKKRSVYPSDYEPPQKMANPVVASFVFAPMLARAKLAGAKAMICVMKGCSADNAANQYLPFIKPYQDLPAVWVDEEQAEIIYEVCKKGGTATLVLEADVLKNCPTDTIYAVRKGKKDKETIFINTHTDGTNAFEENGGIGVLSLANHFKDKQMDRTLVFSFVTGHFQIPQFGNAMNQATTKFLKAHRELWNGKDDNAKAVAGISIEHLGCSEWHDSEDGKEFIKYDDIDPELVYISNKQLNILYLECLEGRKHCKTLTLKPKNLVHFGEGQPMFKAGIPTIALVPGPDYLCTNSPNGDIDKVNYELMMEQIETFKKIIERLDKMPVDDIGKCEPFSFGLKM